MQTKALKSAVSVIICSSVPRLIHVHCSTGLELEIDRMCLHGWVLVLFKLHVFGRFERSGEGSKTYVTLLFFAEQ